MKIWLVILFLTRKKFHAKQICVLSSAMKLAPDINLIRFDAMTDKWQMRGCCFPFAGMITGAIMCLLGLECPRQNPYPSWVTCWGCSLTKK